MLTQAGEDLTTWVYNNTSLKDSVINSVYETLNDASTVPAKVIAQQMLAVGQWGRGELVAQLAGVLKARQRPTGSFDDDIYSDIPAYEALGAAGQISVITEVYARNYLLCQQSVASATYGSWGGTYGGTYYPDFMTTCQAIRTLTYLPGAASDQQIQAAINNSLAYLRKTWPWPGTIRQKASG
ncbi:hypothetical protein [Neomoorella mulderi]|uniref:Uncharacterized protein n=1 Tax=Moorella mulderi DSM 14980 TaxID=1122241 RepID=A0A151AZB6_9FIRM|nr:hypothetical protein [Moorella mulderi]KYH32910.1 hypothetical protein MOMUL_06880 [Moorella mulderi DSM 14980]